MAEVGGPSRNATREVSSSTESAVYLDRVVGARLNRRRAPATETTTNPVAKSKSDAGSGTLDVLNPPGVGGSPGGVGPSEGGGMKSSGLVGGTTIV
jgi:hypothetical protein